MLRPLVKWAGGKRWLIPELIARLPQGWRRYYEPFAGGVALLVELYNRGLLQSGVISDTNQELVNLYLVVKGSPHQLIEALKALPYGNNPASYYSARERFNSLMGKGDPIERAALFLYLNRHCYNGLWRVNTRGEFNVPFGRYERPSLPSEGDILKFHDMLQRIEVRNVDFEDAVVDVGREDLVYFDPPYQPISETSYFTDYTSEGFTIKDQVRLARVFQELSDRGSYVILSNSDVEEIRTLYAKFHVEEVVANRFINSKTDRRRGARELVITNYEVKRRSQGELQLEQEEY